MSERLPARRILFAAVTPRIKTWRWTRLVNKGHGWCAHFGPFWLGWTSPTWLSRLRTLR